MSVKFKKEDIMKVSAAKRPSISESVQEFFGHRSELKHRRKLLLRNKLDKAGFEISNAKASKIVFIACVLLNIFITVYAFMRFSEYFEGNYAFAALVLVFIWVFVFAIVIFVVWFAFYLMLDLVIFNRKQKMEEVLPDFLQLTSSNIRAGMTIDQALWFAVRPRFGVLAKEIEVVAKRTFAGEPLDEALQHLVKKYDSKVLERSINLLVEGLRAGGELGDLLNKIATNIQETSLMKKEMAANVTTYVIFISFATLVAAPFLFGMAVQLILVIQQVFSKVDIGPGAATGFPISISEGVVAIDDFKMFAIISLMITSFFSAIIVSTIKKGNIKSGIRYIPAFMVASVILFLLVVKMFSFFVEGFF